MKIFILIVSVLLAFVAGFGVAVKYAESKSAENEFKAFLHYAPTLLYLQKNQIPEAKYALYTAIDGTLAGFSKDNGESLSPESRAALKKVLIKLNPYWEIDKPFDSEKSASLKSIPEWVEMRARNDAFRNGFVAQ